VYVIADNFYPCSTLPANMAKVKPLFVSVSGQQLLCQAESHKFIYESTQDSIDRETLHLLGIYNKRPCYALFHAPNTPIPLGFEWRALRSFLGQVDDLHFDLAGRACQIISWDREHRFCGSCGQETAASPVDNARICHDCNKQFYPRISPCVIVVITREDHCLLARNAAWERQYFSALAGFVEPGETVEHALHREVKEEVSIEVENLKYFGSQPWPFPGQLMLGFHAEYKAGEIEVDQREIAEADWWHYQNLPPCPNPYTLSGRLIEHFVNQCIELGR
jgi:NAD+ diphosphatase